MDHHHSIGDESTERKVKMAVAARATWIMDNLASDWERRDLDLDSHAPMIDIPAMIMVLVSLSHAARMSDAELIAGVSAFQRDSARARLEREAP